MHKVYRLKNGYSISKRDFYDGFNNNIRWCVFKPNGEFYLSFISYKEAYEVASHLVEEAN